jgi:hypothetical protein
MPPTPPASQREHAGLAHGFASFLIELAIALHNHGVYPPGHPLLARSAETVVRRLSVLLADRGTLSVGVARRQLVIEGVATDPGHPVLSGMAARLHRHRVGALTLGLGLEADEASAFLSELALRTAEGAGPEEGWMEGGWLHARLHPLSFAQLELVGDGDAPEGGGRVRAAQLWLGLARAALSAGPAADDDVPDAAEVARAIDGHPRAGAYDQVIVGYLLQLAEELRTEGAGTAQVRARMSEMVARLRPDTLRRLVEMGGDAAQRHRFLLDASHALAADAVVRLVHGAAETSGQTLSHAMTRLLAKLAAHAGAAAAPGVADAALREQVERLVGRWTLADPNPDGYRQALEAMSRAAAAPATQPGGDAGTDADRIVQMALETGAAGPAVLRAVGALLAGGSAARLAVLLDGAPAPAEWVDDAWARLCTAETVRTLLRGGTEAAEGLNRVLARMGGNAAPALLDEMADSASRTVRRAAVGRLARMGAAAAPHVAARLDDPRWYVLRNLLAVLAEAGTLPAGFSPAPFLRHGDPRVRREAFKLAFGMPDERVRALAVALTDADPQVQRAALAECLAGCPAPVLPLVSRRVEDGGDAELRTLAIRVLGASAEPGALQALLRLAGRGRTLLGRVRLAPRSPEMLAAVAALARDWAQHPAAAPLLAEARRSPDPEILRAVLPHRPT